MSSTTPSITLEEPNPIAGMKVPFKLSVDALVASGKLEYGIPPSKATLFAGLIA